MKQSEFLAKLQAEVKARFIKLSNEEKSIMRANVGTPYAKILKEVLGEKILGGLRVNPTDQVKSEVKQPTSPTGLLS